MYRKLIEKHKIEDPEFEQEYPTIKEADSHEEAGFNYENGGTEGQNGEGDYSQILDKEEGENEAKDGAEGAEEGTEKKEGGEAALQDPEEGENGGQPPEEEDIEEDEEAISPRMEQSQLEMSPTHPDGPTGPAAKYHMATIKLIADEIGYRMRTYEYDPKKTHKVSHTTLIIPLGLQVHRARGRVSDAGSSRKVGSVISL